MRGAIVLLAGLAVTGAANAAPPLVTANATPASGIAPLRVTLTAGGDDAAYTWELGDGTVAAGPVVGHTYAPGAYTATVTATNAAGETAQAQVAVSAAARRLTLEAPETAAFGGPALLAGSLVPAVRGARVQIYRGTTHVTSARVGGDGRYRARILLRSPGPYHARYGAARTRGHLVLLRPRVELPRLGAIPVGARVDLRPRLVPARAGVVSLRVFRDAKLLRARQRALSLPTATRGALRIELTVRPRPGFAAARVVRRVQVVLPSLARGDRGPSVRLLEERLVELRYALQRVDDVYGPDTSDAVLAFQKVHGLPRTGRVEPSLWGRLAGARVPQARRGGDYLEVDKTRQVLYVVRGGRVDRVVHVSTGVTGNTPLGSWRVYRKVVGWDWVLWYPLYFLRGFAIHGYPSVPAYPASHGCVRVPMWIAPSLFGAHDYGTTILVRA